MKQIITWLTRNAHLLFFTFATCCLIGLVLSWGVFILDSVEREHNLIVSQLSHSQKLVRTYYEMQNLPPVLGRSLIDERFIVYECGRNDVWNRWVLAMTKWNGVCLKPAESIIMEIKRNYERKQVRVRGESALMAILLIIALMMLWRLFAAERKFLKELERFIEIVIHGLKGPAAGLRVVLETIKSTELSRSELVEFADAGLVEIERQQRSVENILYATRRRKRAWELKMEIVEVKNVIDEIVAGCRGLLKKGAEVKAMVPEGVKIIADRNVLRIILENLIDNAIKYSLQENPSAEIFCFTEGNKVIIAVKDKGIGIKKEDLPYLFEPLWRGSKIERKGTGLGLYIVKKLVRLLDGEVSISSEGEGRGTTVTLVFNAFDN